MTTRAKIGGEAIRALRRHQARERIEDDGFITVHPKLEPTVVDLIYAGIRDDIAHLQDQIDELLAAVFPEAKP